MTHPRRTRRSTHPLSLALCGGLLVTGIFTAAPATASMPILVSPPGFGGPGGCTTVTSDGAMLCLWIDDDTSRGPLFVKTVRGAFGHPNSSEQHICDDHYELTYYRDGVQRTDRFDQFGCSDGLNTADFALNAPLDWDKPICTRTTNSQTADHWTHPTCVTVHRDSSDVGDS